MISKRRKHLQSNISATTIDCKTVNLKAEYQALLSKSVMPKKYGSVVKSLVAFDHDIT
jgi:hypothetical protein